MMSQTTSIAAGTPHEDEAGPSPPSITTDRSDADVDGTGAAVTADHDDAPAEGLPVRRPGATTTSEQPSAAVLPVANEVDDTGVPTAAPDLEWAGGGDGDDDKGNNNRWRLLTVGGGIVLLAVALGVGLSVGLTKRSSSSSSLSSSEAAQTTSTATPAPAPAPLLLTADPRCYDEYYAFDNCFGGSGGDESNSNNQTSKCGRCIATYYSTVLRINLGDVYNASCQDVDNETCDALTSCTDACDNNRCEQEFITYFECASLCTLTGTYCKNIDTKVPTSSPQPTTTPAPTPSIWLRCPNEYDSFAQCTNQSGTIAQCQSCVSDRLSVGGLDGCSQLDRLVCGMMDGCPSCGNCQETYVVYMSCVFADSCPAIDCSTRRALGVA